MTWFIKSSIKTNGNKSGVQQSVIDIKKIEKREAAFLASGDSFYQVFGSIVTRKLRFSPEEFNDPERYKRELDSIGVWVEKKKSTRLTKKRFTNGNINF